MVRDRPLIAVVGGGITGAFAAYHLATLGATALLLERDATGAHASANNTGGLNPMHGPGIPGPLEDLAMTSFELHRRAWQDIRRRGGDFAGRVVSRLDVALDPLDADQLAQSVERYDAVPGLTARWLPPEELRGQEPRLSASLLGGLLTEGNLRVEPAAYTRAVTAAAVDLGARVQRADVAEIRHRNGIVTGVVCDSRVTACDGLVLATGPWCAEPARWLNVALPVEPVRGELLLMDQPVPGITHDITCGPFGVYPTTDGRVWLGGTEDRVGFEAAPSPGARANIQAGVRRVISALESGRIIRQTAALRPVSADGLPIVGRAPGWQNVALALAGGRKGMLLAAGLGRAAAEILVLGQTSVPISACHADRPGLAS
jgi:glycine oxidase